MSKVSLTIVVSSRFAAAGQGADAAFGNLSVGDVEVVAVPSGGEETAAKNRAIEEARGTHIAFLTNGERYVSPCVAEILALTAKTSGHHVCGGSGGLASYVFDREWLASTGIRFSDADRNGGDFLLAALGEDGGGCIQKDRLVAAAPCGCAGSFPVEELGVGDAESGAGLRSAVESLRGGLFCIGVASGDNATDRCLDILSANPVVDAVVVSSAARGAEGMRLQPEHIERFAVSPLALVARRKLALKVLDVCPRAGDDLAVFVWAMLLGAGDVRAVAANPVCGAVRLAYGIDTAERAKTMHDMLFEFDRLDMAGVAYTAMAEAAAAGKMEEDALGEVLNATGYPYLASMMAQTGRTLPSVGRLPEFCNRAAGSGAARFADGGSRPLGTGKAAVAAAGKPGLSIVMPVYNVEAYLARAIESVRHQTSGDWELICVDDGSRDDSPGILDYYAGQDARIRVVHKENSGVSDTRNTGLAMARGRYVAFIDGDDWYEPTMVEQVMARADAADLDVCFFDFCCRNFQTLKKEYHFWTFAHLARHWGVGGSVFSTKDLDKWWYYGSMCQTAWKVSFLVRHGGEFPRIPLGEDVAVMSRLFPFVGRGCVINRPLYNYQRGNPTSAVSRMGVEKGVAFVQKYETLLGIYRDVYLAKTDEETRSKFIGRMLSDIVYDCTHAPIAAEWMRTKGREGFGLDRIDAKRLLDACHLTGLEKILAGEEAGPARPPATGCVLPDGARRLMGEIERERASRKVKDLYVVAAQLASDNDEAIDGWSFFLYLKQRNVPAKFVVWRKHRRCGEFKAAYPDDVIEIADPSGTSFDFLVRCKEALVRAKAVAVEWAVSNQAISEWLSSLQGCTYVFLQHGLTYNPPRPVHVHWWTPFNLINFCSEREKDLVLPVLGERGQQITPVVAGLPRWDLLKDEQDPRDRVVFVMFTWRPTFNQNKDDFGRSAYCAGLKALLSAERLETLRRKGMRVVLALHHSLRDMNAAELGFSGDVEIAAPTDVSRWIRKASCLVTDFSSVSFDFWYLKKPVVYWIPDRFDGILTSADQCKVREAAAFLRTFADTKRSAGEVVDALVRHADAGFGIDGDMAGRLAAFFSPGGEFRRRIYEAVEAISAREACE